VPRRQSAPLCISRCHQWCRLSAWHPTSGTVPLNRMDVSLRSLVRQGILVQPCTAVVAIGGATPVGDCHLCDTRASTETRVVSCRCFCGHLSHRSDQSSSTSTSTDVMGCLLCWPVAAHVKIVSPPGLTVSYVAAACRVGILRLYIIRKAGAGLFSQAVKQICRLTAVIVWHHAWFLGMAQALNCVGSGSACCRTALWQRLFVCHVARLVLNIGCPGPIKSQQLQPFLVRFCCQARMRNKQPQVQ
jgi:hypothetical protein